MSQEFSPEQRRWLEGFASGISATRGVGAGAAPATGAPSHAGPDADALKAQDAAASNGKLNDQEKWKRAENPLDAYERLKRQALTGQAPKPDDNFRWRYHGLFYVAPAQTSYMCRMRIPNGILTHWQLAAVAEIAERRGGGYAHVTTRANLQIREIKPENGPFVIDDLTSVGIISKGSGSDNIRNVTGSSTAGIDPQELHDTRQDARDWHYHIINDRSLYGLPRKFNVAFDGGGVIPTLEDTNDIGFQAVTVLPGADVEPGLWYRLAIGGISGHKDLARDTGVILKPQDATQVADAIIRVFIDSGDRTNRNKARLKYVLDSWGFDKFLREVEKKLGRPLQRIEAQHVAPRPPHDRMAHLGVHAQKQDGLRWIGVWTPLGKMTAAQMRALADVARTHGDGDIRLTVWQNLLISGVPEAQVDAAVAAIAAAGLAIEVSYVRAGLVACTGNRGCKFAASDTKGHALIIADHLDATVSVDQPVNIHVTGCHNSCAQHYIGDVGLIGAKVTINDDGDQVEGYTIHVGGGFGAHGAIGREIYPDTKATDAPALIERLLKAYLAHRAAPEESFQAFTARYDIDALKALAESAAP